MSEEQQTKNGCGWLPFLLFGAVAVFLVIGLLVPTFGTVNPRANTVATKGNCLQILNALKAYANQHGGKYPDASEVEATTSNQAFRLLIWSGILDDERIFGGKMTRYAPDNITGDHPDYLEALEPGENHWAMTKGVTDKSPPKMPLVFENAVSNSWPPKWNADSAGKKEPGRAWKGGKIIVGFNDGSVEVIQLESAKGTSVGPKKGADGKDVFTRAAESMQILDIER